MWDKNIEYNTIFQYNNIYYLVVGFDSISNKYICRRLNSSNFDYLKENILEKCEIFDFDKLKSSIEYKFKELTFANIVLDEFYNEKNKLYNQLNPNYTSNCFNRLFIRLKNVNKQIAACKNNIAIAKTEEIKNFYRNELFKSLKGKRRIFKRLYFYVNRNKFDDFVYIMEKYNWNKSFIVKELEYTKTLFENIQTLEKALM